MRDAENIQQLDRVNDVDWMGFIFTPKSKRYVLSEPSLKLGTDKTKVGVFVDEPIESLVQKVIDFNLDIIQLHGFENLSYIDNLKAEISNHIKRPIYFIKVFRVDQAFDFDITKPYENKVNYFLFDTKGVDAGGNGIQFDWSILDNYKGSTPFVLAGGIGPKDLDKLSNFNHQNWLGIDVNSGFENSPGNKDVHAIQEFSKKFKSINRKSGGLINA